MKVRDISQGFFFNYANVAMLLWTDPEPIHVVSTFIEMPEGASVSDNENKNDNDADDPHKALDIDLDVYVFHRFIHTTSFQPCIHLSIFPSILGLCEVMRSFRSKVTRRLWKMLPWKIPPPIHGGERRKEPTKRPTKSRIRRNRNPTCQTPKGMTSMASHPIAKSLKNPKARRKTLPNWIWWLDLLSNQNHRRNHRNRRKRKSLRKRNHRPKPVKMQPSLATRKHWASQHRAKRFSRIPSRF